MIDSRSIADTLADIRLEKDVQAEVHRFARSLGFDTYTLGYINPSVSERAFFIDNHPDASFDIPDIATRDPVLARLKGEPIPFSWDRSFYVDAKCEDIWEAGSHVGISAGLIAPVRPGGDRRMVISLDRDQPLDGTREQIADQLGRLDKFTRLLSGTVVSLFDSLSQLENSLSSAEKEVLRWTYAGLSSLELARRLRPHKGYDFVQQTLKSAAMKMGTTDPMTASILAARAGVLGQI
ncbi:autoinducer binding domain-containing protein [Chitinimonas arctica]|uniref:autoinducer binding domain-containing protein n=1 Tax=Chitinimonas arctica TaxID=2594795 RepID=UPI0015D2DDBB|nr:autoinducer binding domain-containing protein [Chitinimonas arctica]